MRVDFNTITGKIKPMHAINNMPMIEAFASDDMFHYAGEAGQTGDGAVFVTKK